MNDKTHRAPTYKVVDDFEYATHSYNGPHSHHNYGGPEAGFGYVTYVSPSCEEIEQKLEKMLEEGWRLVACLNGYGHQQTKFIFERYNRQSNEHTPPPTPQREKVRDPIGKDLECEQNGLSG